MAMIVTAAGVVLGFKQRRVRTTLVQFLTDDGNDVTTSRRGWLHFLE
jgi:hypothetical protein